MHQTLRSGEGKVTKGRKACCRLLWRFLEGDRDCRCPHGTPKARRLPERLWWSLMFRS